jgi:septum formation protein
MTLWQDARPPVLASASPSRQFLLRNAGLSFLVEPADLDERAVEKEAGITDPSDVARLLAKAKAQAVSLRLPGHHVIGADQTLALGRRRFSKPADLGEAAATLRALRGATHALHSGVAVAVDGKVIFDHVATARLTMRPLSDAFIGAYLADAGETVTASVGAYQLEWLGVHLFERIEGDHFTILGLPLLPLLDFFRARGLLAG